MTLRYGLTTAVELLEKLRRDLARLDDEVIGDHLFNFVVTARHLPEWFAKDPAMSEPVRAAIEGITASPLYKACRDIADASKHFQLRADRAQSTNVSEVSSARGYGVGRYGKGAYGVGEESITIELDTGESIHALEFARQIVGMYDAAIEHAP